MGIEKRLKKRLAELDMKQNQLAAKLNISPSTLNGYFTGYREPDLETLARLAEALDTTVEYLATGNTSYTIEHRPKESPAVFETEEARKEYELELIRSVFIEVGIIPPDRSLTEEEMEDILRIAQIFLDSKRKGAE